MYFSMITILMLQLGDINLTFQAHSNIFWYNSKSDGAL